MKTSTGGQRAAASGTSSVPSILHCTPHAPDLDGVLITWGDRLFYPGNRIVQVKPQPKLGASGAHQRANAIRQHIPQVMVKVTGGGRSMAAIAAHFRYISKNGRLEIEDQRGETLQGKDSLHHLADEWRMGGARIPDDAEPSPMGAVLDQLEHVKASIRAKVEHPFRVIKRQFGHVKVRYRGLAKNTAQLHTLFALSNLWMARRRLLQGAQA